jgi:hypothetical protein
MALVTTTKGDMDESLLVKQEGTVDNDNELTTWVEYWLDGELVHRSAHVTLKKPPTFAGGEQLRFKENIKWQILNQCVPRSWAS